LHFVIAVLYSKHNRDAIKKKLPAGAGITDIGKALGAVSSCLLI